MKSIPRAGISHIGLYVPEGRLDSSSLPAFLNASKTHNRSRSVGYFDEDIVSMAVAAAQSCLQEFIDIDALFFCSNSVLFSGKQISSLLIDVLGLRKECRSLDFTGSSRSTTSAVLTALELIEKDVFKHVLVVASESQVANVGSYEELLVGDGAGALLLSEANVGLQFLNGYSWSQGYSSNWKPEQSPYLQFDDSRFAAHHAFENGIQLAIKNYCAKYNIQSSNIDAIADSPTDIYRRPLIHRFELRQNLFVASTTAKTGSLGSADSIISLVNTMARVQVGQQILWLNSSNGCDLLLFETVDQNFIDTCRISIEASISRSRLLQNYTSYLTFKEILKTENSNRYRVFSSSPMLEREKDILWQLQAKKCNQCGEVITLKVAACPYCHGSSMRPFRLARKGVVYSFTNEFYYPSPDASTPMAIIDLEGGGRILCQVTNINKTDVKIGSVVSLTFRRMHHDANNIYYGWKCQLLVA